MDEIAAHIAREEFWSTIGFWVLVIGLAGDILVLVIPEHRKRLEKILAACFIIVIIVGVAIEHRADASISALVSQEQSANALQIAQLNKQATLLSKEAEDERLVRVKLEAQIAPRRLTIEQKEKIILNCIRLKDMSTGKRVRVVSYSLDTEGFVFSEEIVSSLRASGMVVDDDSMSIIPTNTFVMGIDVFGSDSILAKGIANAIGSSGSPIAVSFVAADPTVGAIKVEYGAPVPQVTVLVGLKPPDKDTIDEIKRTMTRK